MLHGNLDRQRLNMVLVIKFIKGGEYMIQDLIQSIIEFFKPKEPAYVPVEA